MDLLICAIANNNKPSFVDYQYECFKKYINGGKFEYILFDNSNNSEEFKRHCDYVGAFYVKVQDTSQKELSNLILNNVYNLMKFRGILLICNLDIFLVDNFDYLSLLTDCGVASVNDRKDIFIDNDFLLINLQKLNLTTDNVNDVRPSMLQDYIKKSKNLIFKVISIGNFKNLNGCKTYEDIFLKYNQSDCTDDNLFEFLCNKLVSWNIKYDDKNKYIISFSLYGNNPRYTYNAVINVLIAKKIYKGWICRFYYDNTVPNKIIEVLDSFDNTEMIKIETTNNSASSERMFWRFFPASEDDVAAMIVRDSDAWLSLREAIQVKKWIESDKAFHILRDHCHHTSKVMGGMWGVKRGKLLDLKNLSKIQANGQKNYGDDQIFLERIIYPLILDSVMIHFTSGINNDKWLHFEPFESYPRILEYIPGIDIEKTNDINSFLCSSCKKTHSFFIGIQLFNLHEATKGLLSKYGL